MDLSKLKKSEIRAFDDNRLKEVEHDIRKEIALVRLSIEAKKGSTVAKKALLRKNLARVLTAMSSLKTEG